MNGFALLLDRTGADSYHSTSGHKATAAAYATGGGRDALNLGILIDAGGFDSYDRMGRADSKSLREPRVGLFSDR